VKNYIEEQSNPLANLPLLIKEVKKEMEKKKAITKRQILKDANGCYIM